MQNEFEKNVQHQMEQFEIVPEEAVWQKVEDRINKQRRKRRVFYYWFSAAVLVALLTASYFFIASDKEHALALKEQSSQINKQRIKKDFDSKDESADSNNKTLKQDELKKQSRQDEKYGNSNKDLINRTILNKNEFKGGHTSKDVDKSNASIGVIESNKQRGASKVKNETIGDDVVFDNFKNKLTKPIQELENSNALIDTIQVMARTEENIIIDKKDSAITFKKDEYVTSKSTAKSSKNKIEFGITVLSGISNNLDAFIGLPTAQSARALYAASASNASPNNYTYTVNNYKSSLTTGIGVFAEKKMGKKAGLSMGVNYQSYTVKLSVGNRVDSSRTVQDPRLKKIASPSSFYKTGQTNDYKNRYHLVEVPVNVQWRLNRDELKPLQLFAGIKPGFIVNSNALYYNPYQGIYYKEKDQLRNFQLGLQTGLTFTAATTPKYKLQLAPTMAYNITNLTKSAVITKEHLFFFGLKTSLIIKNKSSLK